MDTVLRIMAKRVMCVSGVLLLTACAGTKSMEVAEYHRQDKHLDCTQLKLEMTEAEYFRDRAAKNRAFSIKHVVMPLGYPSTYMSAENAMEAANGRIEYLSRLYAVRNCAGQSYAHAAPQAIMPERAGYHQASAIYPVAEGYGGAPQTMPAMALVPRLGGY